MLKKLINLFKGNKASHGLYTKLVTQSRSPLYYTDYGVEDTPTGRFENIVVHLFLIIHRIAQEEGNKSNAIRDLQECFVMDMDRNLREMGVGDMSVGKQMKKMAAGWFGTAKSYEAALLSVKEGREAVATLETALLENLYRDKADAPVAAMASHIRAVDTHLASLPLESVTSGNFDYPPITPLSTPSAPSAQ